MLCIGCANKEIPTVKEEYTMCGESFNENEETTVKELAKANDFKCSNLDAYLSYLDDNQNATNDNVVLLVNQGITEPYSDYLINIVKAKYFIKNNLKLYLSNKQDTIDNTISYVNAGLNNAYYTNTVASDLTKDILILVNKYHYLDDSYEPSDLEVIDSNFNRGSNNKLRHDAKVAFEEMASAAKTDNIMLYNRSAYRSYQTQESIYNRSVANYGVLESDKSSARPGYSEHQTGLALDVNLIDTSFKDTDTYKWLCNNAYKYGFILRYPKDKTAITGYSYEPWHYRFVGKEVAQIIKEEGITFDEYYAYYVAN
jgi:LAS superfamily LD-carboxypeptidase LdcB